MHVTAIIAAAGAGRRAGGGTPKQWLDLGGRSMLARSVAAFDTHPRVTDLVVVVPPGSDKDAGGHVGATSRRVSVVSGGPRRQDSVANGFDAVPPQADVVLIHDAARPFVGADLIGRTIDAAAAHGAAIAALPAHDTVKRAKPSRDQFVIVETIPRETIFLAQTPQGFRRDVLAAAIALGRSGVEATDEAALAERAGYAVHLVPGDPGNVKVTTEEDVATARQRAAEATVAPGRVGTGYDLHRLVPGRPLVIGGVTIPFDRGPLGHSDGDVVCHAATDAVLGAASLGDIGSYFPDSDPAWKGASSVELLRRAAEMTRERGFQIVNLDVTVILEQPKLRPHVDRMRAAIGGALGIDEDRVSIKGKTNEGMDAIGRGEAIAALAVALLRTRHR